MNLTRFGSSKDCWNISSLSWFPLGGVMLPYPRRCIFIFVTQPLMYQIRRQEIPHQPAEKGSASLHDASSHLPRDALIQSHVLKMKFLLHYAEFIVKRPHRVGLTQSSSSAAATATSVFGPLRRVVPRTGGLGVLSVPPWCSAQWTCALVAALIVLPLRGCGCYCFHFHPWD